MSENNPTAQTIESIAPLIPQPSSTVLLTGADTGGHLALITTIEVPGSEPPCHCHHEADEVLYVLSGDVVVHIGERWVRATAGSAVAIPRGIGHCYWVLSPTAQILTMLTPAGFEAFYGDRQTGSPWASSTPIEVERLIATAAQYGCAIMGRHQEPLPHELISLSSSH